ncbi:MAG: DUF2971 domain-containing protein [Sulfurimonas sp.]|nr:DUF2971 domain-containing protein [Sulfurimonas sp.]
MDLAKFISLISTKSIYFTNPRNFDDPYEFYLPNSYNDALNSIYLKQEKELRKVCSSMIECKPGIQDTLEYKKVVKKIEELPKHEELTNVVKERFGVSCWHINDCENAALWKIYTNQGQGIAIETTDEKLKESLISNEEIIFDSVRYEDYFTGEIIKGYHSYAGFIKRKSFAYEKEYRAMILLNKENYGEGSLVKVDLNNLIEKIHISPSMPKFFFDAVKYICKNEIKELDNKLYHSKLYEK